jgi:O-antigen/teichoic acid export membrane protein
LRQLSRNAISIILSDAGRRALGFFTIALLARRLAPADFGVITIGFTVLSYATMAAAGGLGAFGIRAVARGEASLEVSSVIGARLVNSIIAFFIVGLSFFFIANRMTALLVLCFSVSLFPNAFLLDWYFQGKEEMPRVGVARTASAATYLVLAALFVRSPADLLWVAAAAVCGDCVAAGILLLSYHRMNPGIRLRPAFAEWKSLTLMAFPLGLGSILAQASVNLPPLVIGIMLTNADVGIYSAAAKLVGFLLMIDRVIATLLLPASARSYTRSVTALSEVLSGSLKLMIIAGLPLCIGGTILAPRILPLVFGAQYASSGPVFSVLAWFVFATLLHTLCTTGLIASGQERLYTKSMLIGAGFTVCSTLVLTALFGVVGSAAGVVCSELATVIVMLRKLRDFVRLEIPGYGVKSLAAAGAMAVVLLPLASTNLSISVPTGVIVYTLVLFATRAISGTEIAEMFRSV